MADRGIKPPAHCPGCGCRLGDVVELVADTEDTELYDCYCGACGWSGDISPDLTDEEATRDHGSRPS